MTIPHCPELLFLHSAQDNLLSKVEEIPDESEGKESFHRSKKQE